MGLFDKVKSKLSDNGQASFQSSQGNQQVPDFPLGTESIIRYRKQRGVNLGAWFSQEAWITSDPFQNAVNPRQSDLDIAKGEKGKEALEHHWDTWISQDDWRWIVDSGFNTVRLPIGYYHLASPSACPSALKKTDFESHAQVFEGAWDRIERAIQTAGQYGLGILVDLHGVSGNQNDDAHSGTSSGKTQLWDSKKNLDSTALALQFLTRYLSPIPHVVGLQLMNEPKNNGKLGGWYESTIRDLRRIAGPWFPLYIHDAWDCQWYSQYPSKFSNEFLVVDHHLYRCFTEDDRNLSGDQHAQTLTGPFKSTFSTWSRNSNKSMIIGEFSASLDPHSFPPNCDDTEKDRHRRVFLRAQLDLYEEFCAGWFFWTLKKGNGWDAGWSAKDSMTAEILPRWVGGKVKRQDLGGVSQEQSLKGLLDSHVEYWSTQPGPKEHDRFQEGLYQGWDDAVLFIDHPFGPQKGTNVIGFEAPWLQRRKQEHLVRKGDGPCVWEYEHGWRQGVSAAQEAFLV